MSNVKLVDEIYVEVPPFVAAQFEGMKRPNPEPILK
jgi:hypothetical protein